MLRIQSQSLSLARNAARVRHPSSRSRLVVSPSKYRYNRCYVQHRRRIGDVPRCCRFSTSFQQKQKQEQEQQQKKTQILPAQEEHERKVAARQELIRRRHEQQVQKLATDQEVKSKRQEHDRRKVILGMVNHWLAKDPSFFSATMNALNLTSQWNDHADDGHATSFRQGGSNGKESPVVGIWNQYRRLYFESLPSFKQSLQDGHITDGLKKEFSKLDKVGFADTEWAGRFRRVRGYKRQRGMLERQADNQRVKIKESESILAKNLKELKELERAERNIDKKIAQTKNTSQDPSTLSSTPEETSLLSNIFKSLYSYFSPQEDTAPSPEKRHESKNLQAMKAKKRIQNKIDRKQKSIKIFEDAVATQMKKLEDVEENALEFEAPMSEKEYNDARAVVSDIRDGFCKELARHIQERHTHSIEQYQTLDAKTDLTKPHEWYPYARLDKRKIIFHGGPTNSGKTYAALQRLKEAKNGLYLGPLRLLAAEVYESLTADGSYTNLYTGQEQREIAFSTHSSATVEMASVDDEHDIVVVDEIQMIADPSRGASWAKALLGLRCKEIHLCGGLEARNIVEKIVKACGDELEVHTYERFSELQLSRKSLSNDPNVAGAYRNVRPGDCVVAFSRNDIFAIKREIEKTTNYKCCVIYGKLPPQIRADQARQFNDPNSGYDILVASDAIGMGLNLNIKRIIFNTVFKFNGERVVRLNHSEVKQISGRAGRRNSPYPNGEVTCRDPRDLPYIRQCLTTDIPPIEQAALLPTSNHIKLFSDALHSSDLDQETPVDLHEILRQFGSMATVQGDYFLGRQTEMRQVAKHLRKIPLELKDAYTMCLSPTSESALSVLESFAIKYSKGEVSGLSSRSVPRKAQSFDDLSYLCSLYAEADLFLWLQFKFPPSNAVEQQTALARKEKTLEYINEALADTERLKLSHNYIKYATGQRALWQLQDQDEMTDSGLVNTARGRRRRHHNNDDDEDDVNENIFFTDDDFSDDDDDERSHGIRVIA